MMDEFKEATLTDEQLELVDGGNSKQRYIEYTVRAGDTLHKLAKHFNTTVDAIMRLNPIIKDRNLIRVGWNLTIPDNR